MWEPTEKVLTLSVPGLRVVAWVNSFPRRWRPERAEESCWLTVNGRYGMLVFVGKGFHEEFKYGIVIVIHWGPNISGPAVKGLNWAEFKF